MENKIKVAIADFSPLIIEKDGKYKGFEIDLWEAVAKKIGITFKYEKHNFKDIIPLLAERKIDAGIAGITITEKREKIIDFSHPTLDSGLLISVNKKRNNPKILKTVKIIFSEGGKMLKSAALAVLNG